MGSSSENTSISKQDGITLTRESLLSAPLTLHPFILTETIPFPLSTLALPSACPKRMMVVRRENNPAKKPASLL
jgi:hypothetical protein